MILFHKVPGRRECKTQSGVVRRPSYGNVNRRGFLATGWQVNLYGMITFTAGFFKVAFVFAYLATGMI